MSDYPPPIPQKNKHKPLSTCQHLITEDKTSTAQLIPESTLEEGSVNLNVHTFKSLNDSLFSIQNLNDQCQQLRFQDQKLMRIFLFIREEIQLLNESDVLNKSNEITSNHSSLSFNTLTKKETEYSNTGQKIESFLQSYVGKGISEKQDIEPSKLNIYSHFNVAHIGRVIDEFRYKYALSTNSIQNCENNLTENVEGVNPPPVPEKKGKLSNSIPLNGQDSIINGSSNQKLISDPCLNQNWPRSKSFNSNAFLSNHNRQSSMTLSDFYDHLNPIPRTRDQRTTSNRNALNESPTTNPDAKHSPDQNSINNQKPQKFLPMSKSNYDCKISSLESFGNQDTTHSQSSNCRKHNTRSIYDNVDRSNILSSSLNLGSNDGQLTRAGSTPSLFSRSVFTNSTIDHNQDSFENSISQGYRENSRDHFHDKSPNSYFKSKSPKKFFSILSRGISSGFNKNIEKKTTDQKHSTQSSEDIFKTSLRKKDEIVANSSPKNNRLFSSILTPVIENPPPIPPKSQKPNEGAKIDLQQTWC